MHFFRIHALSRLAFASYLLIGANFLMLSAFAESELAPIEDLQTKTETITTVKVTPKNKAASGDIREESMQTVIAPGQSGSTVLKSGDSISKSANTSATVSQDAYGPYFGQVMKEVRKHWYLAKSSWKPNTAVTEPLKTALAFKVLRTGEITDIRIRTSSNNPEFDEFSVQTLKETSPVVPIPETIPQNSIDCFYTVHYNSP